MVGLDWATLPNNNLPAQGKRFCSLLHKINIPITCPQYFIVTKLPESPENDFYLISREVVCSAGFDRCWLIQQDCLELVEFGYFEEATKLRKTVDRAALSLQKIWEEPTCLPAPLCPAIPPGLVSIDFCPLQLKCLPRD